MKVLIIEDEKKLALSLKKALETEGFAVDVCFDGEGGLEQAQIESYDLIILDVGLPSINGLEVSKKLRTEGVRVPILMLTARDTVKNKIEGLNSGADDYVVKPFDFEELLARMHALLRRSKRDGEMVYKVGNLILNPISHVVMRAGKEITLSGKEYMLLEYMMYHSGQILSKTQILEHVWDSEVDPFTNVVDVYIGYLRSKIDKAFAGEEKLIFTVKGLGYRIGPGRGLGPGLPPGPGLS